MGNNKIKIKIDGREIFCRAGESIFKAAMMNGIKIPGLCGHPDFPVKANCRLCVVEVKGRPKLEPACATAAADGMEIQTSSERVKKERNLNLELIFAEHIEKCRTCVWRFQCPLLAYAEKYKINITRFKDRKSRRKKYLFANAVEIDGSQCIDCRNCLDACSLLQKIDYLELKGKGTGQEIVPTKNKNIKCILCGQCAVHCPVSAAQEQAEWPLVEKALKAGKKKIIVQFAPSVRVSIGEDFGLPYGKIVTENIVAGLRALGFNYVFDVNFGADMTTMIEAEELLDRITNKGILPLFTSCCPGWVNYVELYRPDLIPNLTTARSPHVHSAGAIKTYWAEKMKIKTEDIMVVSVMPCTAKKYEAKRPELKINGVYPVDHVITVRELSFMLKKNNIDLKTVKKSAPDSQLGEYSGAAAIFGGSGGVMEAALRAAAFKVCGDNKHKLCRSRIDFTDTRGLKGVKEASVEINGHKLRVAVVNGIGQVKPVLENFDRYDYIEVMACPGGCIGGGGQPIPTTPEIRKKRIEALWKLDKGSKIRRSYENKGAVEAIDWLKKQPGLEHKVLHTNFKKKSKL